MKNNQLLWNMDSLLVEFINNNYRKRRKITKAKVNLALQLLNDVNGLIKTPTGIT